MATVEFKINVENELKRVLDRTPKRSYSAFNGDFLDSLIKTSTKSVTSGDNFTQVQKKITQEFKEYEATFKKRMKRRLEVDSGLDWEEIKDVKAYPAVDAPTMEGQINKTWLASKRAMRNTVIKNQRRFNQAVAHLNDDKIAYLKRMGITGKTEEELLQNIAKEFTNRIGKGLGINMNNREESLRLTTETRLNYEKAKTDLQNKPVVYRLGDRERHCEICLAYADGVYSNIDIAPQLPIHTRCGCYYEEYKI